MQEHVKESGIDEEAFVEEYEARAKEEMKDDLGSLESIMGNQL
jgi:hypothetical protein